MDMRKVMMLAAALAALGPAAGAAPAGSAQDGDLRCYIAATALARSPDRQRASSAAAMSLYYLGRLDGRDPHYDLIGHMKTVAPGLSGPQLELLLTSCSQTLAARGQALNRDAAALRKAPDR
jgi:hypothetical protein